MQSMTGYGRCRVCRDGREMTVELKTVNHRFLDLALRLPRDLAFLEDALRARLTAGEVRRGHVDVYVTYVNARPDAREVRLDAAALSALRRAMEDAEDLLKPFRRATAAEALTLSGALTVTQAEEDCDAVTALALEALDGALQRLLEMRAREGENLAANLLANLDELEALRGRIAERAPSVPEEYRARLTARLQEWQLNAVDPQRVAQEVAIMADRCAIDEELSRLGSHIAQFAENVRGGAEVGRRLDFLIQEMNREVNTIGSKAGDAALAQHVVDAKCVIEKLREQVQNVV